MRPIVLMDVDGVCGFHTRHIADSLGGLAVLEPEDVVQWDLFSLLPSSANDHLQKHMADPGWWASMPVYPGAEEGVAKIREYADVVFVSSPWLPCLGWEAARRDWLKQFGAKPEDIIFGSRKERIRGDVLIDDKIETVIAWARMQGLGYSRRAVLFDAPYNRDVRDQTGYTWVTRVEGWTDLLHRVIPFLADVREGSEK